MLSMQFCKRSFYNYTRNVDLSMEKILSTESEKTVPYLNLNQLKLSKLSSCGDLRASQNQHDTLPAEERRGSWGSWECKILGKNLSGREHSVQTRRLSWQTGSCTEHAALTAHGLQHCPPPLPSLPSLLPPCVGGESGGERLAGVGPAELTAVQGRDCSCNCCCKTKY